MPGIYGPITPVDDFIVDSFGVRGARGATGTVGPAGTPLQTFAITIASNGQVMIPMPTPPTLRSSVRLIVNGATFAAPDIGATATTLTWAGSFPLEPADTVFLEYL